MGTLFSWDIGFKKPHGAWMWIEYISREYVYWKLCWIEQLYLILLNSCQSLRIQCQVTHVVLKWLCLPRWAFLLQELRKISEPPKSTLPHVGQCNGQFLPTWAQLHLPLHPFTALRSCLEAFAARIYGGHDRIFRLKQQELLSCS